MPTPFDAAKMEELLTQISQVIDGDKRQSLFEYIGKKVGDKGEEAVSAYAPLPNGRPLALYYLLNGKRSKFKSKKQQGWFFSSLKKGRFTLPYKRSGELGRSITSKVTATADGVQVLIGTTPNVESWAKYVIGSEEQQSHYHAQSGWQPLSEDVAHALPAILQEAQDATDKWMADNLPKVT